MFRFSAAALLALAASAVAYQVTKPENGSTWDPNEAQIIAWNKVSTDPSTFAITLVHQASQPNTRTLLLDNVDGGSGSVTVNPPNGGWPSGTAYQINFVQDSSHLDSLLAQSQQFDIKASTGSSSSSSSSSASSSSASSASRTVSTGSSSATSLSNSASGTGTGTATSNDLNPTTTDSPTGNNNGASGLGVQAGLFGLVALVGALVA